MRAINWLLSLLFPYRPKSLRENIIALSISDATRRTGR